MEVVRLRVEKLSFALFVVLTMEAVPRPMVVVELMNSSSVLLKVMQLEMQLELEKVMIVIRMAIAPQPEPAVFL